MIDNLIAIHDGRTMRVVSLRGGYVFGAVDGYVGAIGEIYQRCQPIPITEELLLKNGFTYREDRFCGRDLHIYTKKVYGQFMIECTEGFSGDGQYLSNVYELERREERAHTLGNVKYLHQLQNLCNIAGVEMEWKV